MATLEEIRSLFGDGALQHKVQAAIIITAPFEQTAGGRIAQRALRFM